MKVREWFRSNLLDLFVSTDCKSAPSDKTLDLVREQNGNKK